MLIQDMIERKFELIDGRYLQAQATHSKTATIVYNILMHPICGWSFYFKLWWHFLHPIFQRIEIVDKIIAENDPPYYSKNFQKKKSYLNPTTLFWNFMLQELKYQFRMA